jgi:hypothetical protein
MSTLCITLLIRGRVLIFIQFHALSGSRRQKQIVGYGRHQ